MKYVFAMVVSLVVLLPLPAASAGSGDTPVFAVVMMRHGVRSFTHDPPGYSWPDWRPVAPGYLTAHGYRLVRFLGRFYRGYFGERGLPVACRPGGAFVYADLDQRTLETARALIDGLCGSPDALPYFHAADAGPNASDPLFDGADWLGPAGKIDSAASRAAVRTALDKLPMTEYRTDFAALQSLLDPLCHGSCPAADAGANRVVAKPGRLAEVRGPIDAGSSYAESLFLWTAQCGPRFDEAKLREAMEVHVLEYDVNARNAYNPLVKGSNMLAHIVGLLDERAGAAHPDVTVPPLGGAKVAFLSGHDTQLGALGGILDAHWPLGDGMAADDMPPGSALIFELVRRPGGEYRVRLRFVYQTLAQYRSSVQVPGGIAVSPVHLRGCSGNDCSISLARLSALAHRLAARGFVQRAWTPWSDAPLALAPLADPTWTKCVSHG